MSSWLRHDLRRAHHPFVQVLAIVPITLVLLVELLLALVTPASLATAQAAPSLTGKPPVAIVIPSISLQASVVPLELEDDGALSAPANPDMVGWYDLGPGIGAPGNIVLDGHVDWGGRLLAFGHLQQLGLGDAVLLADDVGDVVTYHVVFTGWYDANTDQVDDIFGSTTDQEVTLITCGGVFDQGAHQYLSRLVVRAVRDQAQPFGQLSATAN